MTTPLSASAGPNASSTAMPVHEATAATTAPTIVPAAVAATATTTTAPVAMHNDTFPAPPALYGRGSEYLPKPPMMHLDSSRRHANGSAPVLELGVQFDMVGLAGMKLPGPLTICHTSTGAVVFYRSQVNVHNALFTDTNASGELGSGLPQQAARVVVPEHVQPHVTLFGAQHEALWTLKAKDWHAMEIVASSSPHTSIQVSTSPLTFSFTWTNQVTYHWRLVPIGNGEGIFDFRCYRNDNRTIVAEFTQEATLFVLWEKADVAFTSFLVLSGLLMRDDVESLLRSLGGGPEALQIILDPSFSRAQDDNASVDSSSYHEGSPYDAEHGFGDETTMNRWWINNNGGATSVKSIELDPGVLRCWWGYGFWWTWCPCCMPGGWCDRLWIKCRWGLGRRKPSHTLSRSQQRRQRGWQQQRY